MRHYNTEKHFSLLTQSNIYDHKKFYSTGLRSFIEEWIIR